jgi:Family of unknown function (DUF5947)
MPAERCEMCSLALGSVHDHLVDPSNRRLVCACGACALLFDTKADTKFKRVPRDVHFLTDFHMTNAEWDALLVPIGMAFFFHSTPHARVIALYPSPAGPTESLLALDSWSDIVSRNSALNQLKADVNALLVNRVGCNRGVPPEYYLAPIDECYRLVGMIRASWRGLSGGTDVWREIDGFFAALKKRAAVPSEAAHA